MAATETLWAAYQYILPGEQAPTHRHSASAIRFIIEGSGGHTTIDGEKLELYGNDFVVTPPWVWHAHGNDSDRPIVWMDGLDVPIVTELDTMFFEPLGDLPEPPPKRRDDSTTRFASGGLRPAWEKPTGLASPLLIYRWEESEAALRRLSEVDESPFDGAAMAYVNPATGGSVLPTMSEWIQFLKPNAHTRAHRHTSSAVYCVAEGRGYSVIDGIRFDWERGDIFTLHPWSWHEHAADDREAFLFSLHDTPAIDSLGLFKEEALEENGGHQEVTGVFDR
jgi:gentisate 1,2-dioxygenase